MTAEILTGLVMLIVMLGAIFIGIQISFTLLSSRCPSATSPGHGGVRPRLLPNHRADEEEVLAAVPLFIFMGFLTSRPA